MNTAKHPVSPEEIMALLDGELSAEGAESVSAHTESCAQCQQVFASLLQASRSLAAWTASEAPSQIESGVHSSSRRVASELLNRGSQTFTSRRRWVLGLGAAGLLLVLLAGTVGRRASMQQSAMIAQETAYQHEKAIHAVSEMNLPLAAAARSDDRAEVNRRQFQSADSNGMLRSPGGHAQNAVSVDGQPQQEFDKLETYAKIQRPEQEARAGPMIARTVSLAILVKDFDANRKSLDYILIRYNGYAANLTVSTPQGAARSLQASLRIPAPQLPSALAELKALGHVENESQNGEEVTQQHADLVARLKNSRETEERLQAILTQRTGKISDVLEVEQEIARVRGEIEQMEAEQKNLEHRVDFATIDLKLSEEYKAKLESTTPSFSTQLHNALVNGYRNVADTLVALILFFAEYGPILLFWVALLGTPSWLVWRRWRQAASPAL